MIRDRIISRSLDMTHYIRVKQIDPAYTKDGMNIDQLIDTERVAIVYARENLKTLQKFLDLEKGGNFEAMWEDDMLLSELERFEKAKKEGEESK
jgi:hypothetical protein